MIDRVTTALETVCDRVVVLGPERVGFESWADHGPGSGPLAGLCTALERTDTDQVLLVAVDNPLVRSETLGGLISLAGDTPVVPVDGHGTRQVTCALYPASLAGIAREELGNGGSIQSLLDRVSFQPVTPDEWAARLGTISYEVVCAIGARVERRYGRS